MKDRTRKIIIPFLSAAVIVVSWHGEKAKIIPQYGAVFYEMGLDCKKQCGQDKQLQYFKKAIHYDPLLSVAYYQLALIYQKMGDSAKALEYYKKVTELNPFNLLAKYYVGRQYFKEESYEHSLRYFLGCYNRPECPDDVDYYLARIYDQKKEYMKAAQHYRNIAELHDEYAAEAYSRWVEIGPLYNFVDGLTFSIKIRRLRAEEARPDLADLLEKIVKEAEASGKE